MIEKLTSFWQNDYRLIITCYEGLLLLIAAVLLVSTMKDIIPALFDSRKRESPEFKEKMKSVAIGVVVYVIAALLPVWLPSLISFFNGASAFNVDLSGHSAMSAPTAATN